MNNFFVTVSCVHLVGHNQTGFVAERGVVVLELCLKSVQLFPQVWPHGRGIQYVQQCLAALHVPQK